MRVDRWEGKPLSISVKSPKKELNPFVKWITRFFKRIARLAKRIWKYYFGPRTFWDPW